MSKAKPIYKILDDKGRVLIPKALRDAAEMEHGDIVRLGIQKGVVTAKKVDLVEIGDQSPEAVRHSSARRSNSCRRKRRSASPPVFLSW
jgi:bifunctional DNA-binding transcriptional regulator/antitoxin component of YhaV-PrlF toxin-antitoxin module